MPTPESAGAGPTSASPTGVHGWRLDASELRIFLAVGIILFLTKLPSVVQLTYSPDDYSHANDARFTTTWMALHFIGQGRFGLAGLYALLKLLGLHPVLSSAPLALVAIAEWSLSAVLLARLWALEGHTALAVLVGSLVFSHPYFVDHWWFRFMPVFAASATLLALAGLWWAQAGRRWWLLGALGVCLGLSFFQIALNHCLVVILLGMVLDLVRGPATWASMLDRWRRPIVVLALGVVAYVIAMRVVMLLFGVMAEGRVQFVDLAAAPERLYLVGSLLAQMFLWDTQFGAPLLQALVLAIVFVAVFVVTLRLGLERRAPARSIVALGLMGIAGASIVGLMIVLVEWWPAARTLTGMGFFVGGSVAVASCVRGRRHRAAVGAAGVLILAGFTGVGARLIADQMRLNDRDRALGLQMLDRLETTPQFPSMSTFIAVGHPWVYPDIGSSHELGTSTWAYWWAQADLMREISGRSLRLPTAEEQEEARRACAVAPKWPAADSIVIRNGVGIACF